MNDTNYRSFELPDKVLKSLPTGAVKDTVEHLGKSITRGRYKMGAILPKEDELVEELKVSRTVVREAVKVLCGKGLVRTARRYGSRVCHLDDWNLLDPDVIRWHDPGSPKTARIYTEATDLRLIFEPEAAALAAENASQEQKDLILAAAHKVHRKDEEPKMIGADFAFHSIILKSSGNLMLSQLQNMIYAVLCLSYGTGRHPEPEGEASRRNHIGVAEAIANGDKDLCRSRMRNMLSRNKVIAKEIVASAAPV